MWQNPGFPQSANAIKSGSGVHDRNLGEVMSALREAGMVHHTPGKPPSSGAWMLTVEGTDRPYVVIKDGAAVRVAPPDLGGKFHA